MRRRCRREDGRRKTTVTYFKETTITYRVTTVTHVKVTSVTYIKETTRFERMIPPPQLLKEGAPLPFTINWWSTTSICLKVLFLKFNDMLNIVQSFDTEGIFGAQSDPLTWVTNWCKTI